jgi:hypothetical protein
MIAKGAFAAAGFALAVTLGAGGGSAHAQSKELSDKSVLTLMQYAWAMVPQKFTTPVGKVIEVDKSKPSQTIVPLDIARDVIRVARLSAFAQICDLPEEQKANYQTLMRREEAKAIWTDQQLLFINQLHLFTVMTMTGKVALVEKDGDKQVQVQEGKAPKTETCTDTERKKVQQQIMAYVAANPQPAAASAAPAPAPAPAPTTKRAEPVPASQKK